MGGVLSMCDPTDRFVPAEQLELQRLEEVSAQLTQFIVSLDNQAIKLRKEAKAYATSGHENLAKAKLRLMLRCKAMSAKQAGALATLEQLGLTIENGIGVRTVTYSLKQGSAALQRINAQIGDIDRIKEQVEDGIATAAEIMAVIGDSSSIESAANNGALFDEDELERELAQLVSEDSEASTRAALANLPRPPTTTLADYHKHPTPLVATPTRSSPRQQVAA